MLIKNKVMGFEYTLEECLGKQICVKAFQEDDHVDTATEIWIVSKPADYEAMKKEINDLIGNDMLDEYYFCN